MQKHKREIEMKVLNIDPEKLEQDIMDKWGRKGDEGKVIDMFYDRSKGDLQKHGKTLRIRQSYNRVYLTYKGVVSNKKGLKIRKEFEVEVDDFETTQKILLSLGYKFRKKLQKHRKVFALDGVEIVIDTYHNIPPYAEFEGESKEQIERLIKKLGLQVDYRVSHLGVNGVFKHYGAASGYYQSKNIKEYNQDMLKKTLNSPNQIKSKPFNK